MPITNGSPKVSVLMSVYNNAPYLREAIDSILNQTFTDFEFIIVDDCSTDETPTILNSYSDPRLILLHNNVNRGLAASLNKGLTVSKGMFIARQDADDVSLPERLAKQMQYLSEYPHLALVGSAYIRVYEDGRPTQMVQMPLTDEIIRDRLLYDHCFWHGAVMLRRDCLEAVGGYDSQFRLAQDRDLWLRLAERYPLANLPEPLYKVRVHSASVSISKRLQQRQASRRAVLNALRRDALQFSSVALGRFYWQAALDELAANNKVGSENYVQQAISANNYLANDSDHLIKIAVIRAFETGPAGRSHNKSTDDIRIGLSFLKTVFASLPVEMHQLNQHCRRAVAELQAAYAFTSFRQGKYMATISHSLQAWLKDPLSQLPNLGLTSITVRSLWRLLKQQ